MGSVALLVLSLFLIAAEVLVLARNTKSARGLAELESEALTRSSVLNDERVKAINASRRTARGELIDRLRAGFIGLWLVVAGVSLAIDALR